MANGQDQTQAIPYNTPSWADSGQQQQQAPVNVDPTSGIDLKALMAGPSNVEPYMTGRGQIQPRMPVPMQQVPTNRPTQQQPADTSLYARRTAKQQNIGNLLGNMVGMVANKVAAEKQQKDTKTVTDATNYVQGIQNAQDLKAAYPNDPRMQAMADEAIKRNTESFNNMMKDDKTKKMVGKALSWDFTDPKQMQKPEVQAGVAGVQAAKAQQKAGIAATTPQDAQINTILNRGQAAASTMGQQGQFPGVAPGVMRSGQVSTSPGPRGSVTTAGTPPAAQPSVMGGGPPTAATQQPAPTATQQSRLDQYLASRPVSLEQNPLYAAQQKFEQKLAEDYMRSVLPAYIREQGADKRAIDKNYTDYLRTELQGINALKLQDARGVNALKVQTLRNAGALRDAEIRAGAIIYGKGGGATNITAFNKQLQSMSTQIDNEKLSVERTQNTIKTMTQELNAARSHPVFDKQGKKLYDTQEETTRVKILTDQINAAKASLSKSQDFIDKMGKKRDSFINDYSSAPSAGGSSEADTSGYSSGGGDIPTPIAPARPMAGSADTVKGTYQSKPVVINPHTGDAYSSETGKFVGNIRTGGIDAGQIVGPHEDDDGGIDITTE